MPDSASGPWGRRYPDALAATTPIARVPSLPNYEIPPLDFYSLSDAQAGVLCAATITATGRVPITCGSVSLPAGLTITGSRVTGTAYAAGTRVTLIAAVEWVVDVTVATMIDEVGYSSDGSAFSGTVALRMESVIISGQFKIITTIIGLDPEAGFSYVVKRAAARTARLKSNSRAPPARRSSVTSASPASRKSTTV